MSGSDFRDCAEANREGEAGDGLEKEPDQGNDEGT